MTMKVYSPSVVDSKRSTNVIKGNLIGPRES
jgi:hypothetical protein